MKAGANLQRTLKAQIDEERIENYQRNTSLPFKLGNNKQVAVKIIDDRGIESLKNHKGKRMTNTTDHLIICSPYEKPTATSELQQRNQKI